MRSMVWTKVLPGWRVGQGVRTVWLSGLLAVMPVLAFALDGVATDAGPDGPAQIAYAPANAPGPVVMVISGQTGPASYKNTRRNWPHWATTRCCSPAKIF